MEEESTNFVREHTLDRLINILQSNDRPAKKRAFLEIKNTVKATSGFELKELYDKLASILRICFKDRIESCREDALQITYQFIQRLEPDKSYLMTLIPAVHSRICREEDYEYSEEIRHLHVKFIALLIDKYERDIAPYASNILDILAKLIGDDAPHVKKTSCACLIKCANTVPYEYFQNTKKCLKPLTNNLTHQHWRVRVAAIEALEWTMLKGDNKCIPDLINPLSRCLLDDSPFVRMAITKLSGHWLLELIDRYSFLPNLVPLILTSLTDECEDIVQEAKTLWVKAGDQYVRENEDHYKNRMDYEPLTLEHYPADVTRPGLGCRIMIERQIDKFMKTIGRELTDWVTLVKIKASQLLSQVTLHAEQNVTMQIDKIIGPMSKAAMDQECPEAVKFVRLAAYYMGFFVPPKVYCDLIVEYMKEANHGERKVVASIISGSKREDLREHLPKVASIISGTTFKTRDHEALLEVLTAIFKTCKEDSLSIGEDIFYALVGIMGLCEVPSIVQNASELLQEFVNFAGGDKRKTYDRYCGSLLKSLKQTLWTVHCHEQYMFYVLVTHTCEVIPGNLTEILDIIKEALSEKSDPEVKLNIYMALNEVIKHHENSLPDNESIIVFSKVILEEILPLHLKWYPGRTAEAIRIICCTSLYMILSNFYLDFALPSTIVSLLYGLIEDNAEKTRVLALLSIIAISNNVDLHDAETFSNLIATVIKRLDDCERKVRELAVKCIQNLYEAHLNQEEKNYINLGVLEFVYTTLLIHLDDSEKEFREKVFTCLDSIGSIQPLKLRKKLLEQNFRDKEILKRLRISIEEKLEAMNQNELQNSNQLESKNKTGKEKEEEEDVEVIEKESDSFTESESDSNETVEHKIRIENDRIIEETNAPQENSETVVEEFQQMMQENFNNKFLSLFSEVEGDERNKSELEVRNYSDSVKDENQKEIGQGDS